eukprot:GHVT01078616.1.p1 GENE.GHVT01078616.1~~GHVT01078616.1.p1  ORF type:complete len:181 (-),score=3.40 GHVT01078616.1:233-775(-)
MRGNFRTSTTDGTHRTVSCLTQWRFREPKESQFYRNVIFVCLLSPFRCFTSVRLNHLSEYLGLQISSHAKAVCEASGWTIVEVGTEMFARPSPKCQQEEKKRFVCAQRDVPRILRLDFKEETWTGDDAEQHLPLVPCSGELVSGLESADMAPGATSNHLQQVYSYLRYLGSLDVGGSSQS